jgi:hypothetical protein
MQDMAVQCSHGAARTVHRMTPDFVRSTETRVFRGVEFTQNEIRPGLLLRGSLIDFERDVDKIRDEPIMNASPETHTLVFRAN